MTQAPGRGRLQFLLLAALFFVPLFSAIVLYFFAPQWRPQGHTNYGELIHPARPIPSADLLDLAGQGAGPGALRGKWSFVYLGGADCDPTCSAKLIEIRQIRTLLNEKRLRVQRVYITATTADATAAQAELKANHPDLVFLSDTVEADYRRFFGGQDPQALYLVDPLGNWLMIYPAAAEYKGILKDIKKLLRISQIG